MEIQDRHLVVIAALAAYLVSWLIVRWFASARFNQRRLHSQIAILRARVKEACASSSSSTPSTPPMCLLKEAEAIIVGDKVRSAKDDLIDEVLHPVKSFISQTLYFFTWTGRRELQAWLCVYEAERQSVDYIKPEEVLKRLSTAQAELEKIDQPGAGDLKKMIEGYLKKSEDKSPYLPAEVEVCLPAALPLLSNDLLLKGTIKTPDASLKQRKEEAATEAKQLLKESLRLKHHAYNNDLTGILSLHNKLTWVMLLGLAAIGVLALLGDPAPLFFGGLGGLFSAMQRTRAAGDTALSSSNVVRWIRIYVSPLIGAIAAFVGLLLIPLLASLDLLGQPFQQIPPIINTPAAAAAATATPTVAATTPPLASPTTMATTEVLQLNIGGTPSPFQIVSGTMELAAGAQRLQLSVEPGVEASETTSETAVLAYSAMLALAFILGFSERLFMTFVGKLEPNDSEATDSLKK
jgi:hypothetical protein